MGLSMALNRKILAGRLRGSRIVAKKARISRKSCPKEVSPEL